LKGGRHLFIATDVAKALGFIRADGKAMPSDMVRKLTEEEKALVPNPSGRGRSVIALTEAGLYRCLFSEGTKAAVSFREWVMTDVIPALKGGNISSNVDRTLLEMAEAENRRLTKALLVADKRISFLEKTTKKAESDVSRLQKRRHEILAENRRLASKSKELKKARRKAEANASELNAYAKSLEVQYIQALDDLAKAIGTARQSNSSPVPASERKTVRVDAEGFVIYAD